VSLDFWTLLAIAALALLIGGLLSPLETLGWWAGWFGRSESDLALAQPTATEGAEEQRHFLVFLTGVHSVSGRTFARREQDLLRELRARLPRSAVLEVFPYSVTNRALTGQRVFAWFWRWALSMKLSRRTLAGIAGMVINLRNLWQVAVSADRRYGPLYNQGSAELIVGALVGAGYRIGGGMPVTLIGYSGGGQVAIGAAEHLKEMLGCSVRVISLGGVMSSDPGLRAVHRLYHLAGQRDMVQRASNLFFPGRWRIVPYSAWNQALAAGVIRKIDMGPMDHTGKGGYLDSASFLEDDRTHLQATVDAIAGIVEEAEEEAAEVAEPEGTAVARANPAPAS
jgi:pimeloyl-ACP methyl ester carboxylesterase